MHDSPAEGLFVSLIPDGNRRAVGYNASRYAEAYGGGAEIVGDILKACMGQSRVQIFAAWGSSTSNIRKRSTVEQQVLNGVFHQYLDQLETTIREEPYRNVQVVHLGNPEFVEKSVYRRIDAIAGQTRDRHGKIFALCAGHDSHDEMRRAVAQARRCPQQDWRSFLDLPLRSGRPYREVDLIVRTGTDPLRPYTSGYLLPYQGTGTQERYAADCLPSFSAERFMAFVDDAASQQMRRGA